MTGILQVIAIRPFFSPSASYSYYFLKSNLKKTVEMNKYKRTENEPYSHWIWSLVIKKKRVQKIEKVRQEPLVLTGMLIAAKWILVQSISVGGSKETGVKINGSTS